jgi:hypothetical protein
LQNTLGGEVVWTRDIEGVYIATLAGAFTLGKTALQIHTTNAAFILSSYPNEDANSITVQVEAAELLFIDPNWVYVLQRVEDGALWESFFEIRVYP